ncbi:MAG TPA: hypothetical protein VFB22_15060 [Candidatus Baltobacteraceae bacterium]|nr:hypothetical protein [Candidatus Baltobacteraceae bacterium]
MVRDRGDTRFSWDDDGRSECAVTFTYDGPATEGGLLEAGSVAAAIIGFRGMFERANALANGQKTTITVYVSSTSGCFGIVCRLVVKVAEFVWAHHAEFLDELNSAFNVAKLLVEALRHLFPHGGENEGNATEFPRRARTLAEDPSLQEAVRRAVEAFEDPGVISLVIRIGDLQATITRADLART